MTQWHSFGNDKLADCCIAAVANADMLWDNADESTDEALAAFKAWCNDGRDGGCDTTSVLRNWFWHGFGDKRLGCFGRLAPGNTVQLTKAIKTFGCALVSFTSFPGATPGNHMTLGIRTDDTGITVVTWGQEVHLTWAEYKAAASQAHAISPKWSWLIAWWQIRNDPTWWVFIVTALLALAGIASSVL